MLLYDNQNYLKNHTSQIITQIIWTHFDRLPYMFLEDELSACAPAGRRICVYVTVAATVNVRYLWLQVMLEVSRNGHVTAVTYAT
jgi:hypothetical protein